MKEAESEKGMKIRDLISDLCCEIDEMPSIDEKIDALNYVRRMLSEISPLKHHPVDCVVWEKTDSIKANSYNPNTVAPPEMKLLKQSISEDGYTMPCVAFASDTIEIVDGYHRYTCGASSEIKKSTFGRLPITFIKSDKADLSHRMASTIRHNRARGSHSIELMSNIVSELVESGMSDTWILRNIGMDADELLRLKQITGLAALFKDKEFSNANTDKV